VVQDRYIPSSLVYQGITCGEEYPQTLNRDFPLPELLVFFDIDPHTAQERIRSRAVRDIYEKIAFQEEVRRRYLALLPSFRDRGVRVEYVDASAPREEVAEALWRALQNMPIMEGIVAGTIN
jgi:dTMP kinase